MKKKFIINKWLTVIRAIVNGETPGNDIVDYDGESDYNGEMLVYGEIGTDWLGNKGVDAKDFKTELDKLSGKSVLVRIHSPGGNVWDAFAIRGYIQEHGKVDTRVDGVAASAASVIFQGGKKRIMCQASEQMIHKTSALVAGKAEDMREMADRLDAHDKTLAKMYANRSGNTVEEVTAMMDKETWMDGEECKANGLCDELIEEEPEESVKNQMSQLGNIKDSLSRYRHVPVAINNKYNGGKTTAENKDQIMNRAQMIQLLKAAGVTVADNSTDEWLLAEIGKLRPPVAAAPPIPAPQPAAQPATPVNAEELTKLFNAMKAERDVTRKALVTARVDKIIINDQFPANEHEYLIAEGMRDEKLLDKLEALPARPPGMAPLSHISVESATPQDVVKRIGQNNYVLNSALMGGQRGMSLFDDSERKSIGEGVKNNTKMICDMVDHILPESLREVKPANMKARAEKIGAWLNGITNNGPRNATTTYTGIQIDSGLQRQVILSESMRAFKRRLVIWGCFAHNYGVIPLQGTDVVDVPYYPLYTTVSNRFQAATGYQFPEGTDVASVKQITIGGSGPTNKIAGQDRAYQALTLSSYVLRRQPFVDFMKLGVMRAEQLAYDITNDVINANILAVNFGLPIWNGLPASFTDTTLADLAVAADTLDWPEGDRSIVLSSAYWGNLLKQPYLKAFMNIGSTGVIRAADIGEVYAFSEIYHNPRIPATADGDLIGWMSYPSSVLVATAPIIPAPGVLKMLVNYDIMRDDQTGCGFEFKYWGVPQMDNDVEIIECNYGSGLGELAALRRLTSAPQ